MSNVGWIRLHHTTLDSAIFQDPTLWRVFTWCMLKANFAPSIWRGQIVKRGQFVTGRNTASDELGMSPSTFYRTIMKLVEHGCLSIEANSNWTTVTVCNYETYQTREQQEWTSDDTSGDTTDGHSIRIQEYKNTRVNTPPSPAEGKPDGLASTQQFVNEWNLTDGVRQCRMLTPARIKKFSSRASDPTWDWRAALGHFPLKCFADSDSNWKPDVDWFLRPETVLKILEGSYDWNKQSPGQAAARNTDPRGNFAAGEEYLRMFGQDAN